LSLHDALPILGSCHVEVTEAHGGEIVCLGIATDGAIDGQLGGTVGVGRFGGGAFGDGVLARFAVGGGCGGEHESGRAVFVHSVQQAECGANVAVPVSLRVLGGFADDGLGCAVQHAVESFPQYFCGDPCDVSFDEARAAGDGVGVPGGEVVHDDNVMSGFQQSGTADTSDVSGATGDE